MARRRKRLIAWRSRSCATAIRFRESYGKSNAWRRRNLSCWEQTLTLLTGSVLFLRSVQQTLRFNPGYESQNLFFNDPLYLDKRRYSVAQAEQFFRDLQSRIAAMPEAQSACLAQRMLFDDRSYQGRYALSVAGAEQNPLGDRKIESINVSPQFFVTAGIPLVSGRDFTWQDGPGPDIPLVSGRDNVWQDV